MAGLVLRLVSPLLEFLRFTTDTDGAIVDGTLRELLPLWLLLLLPLTSVLAEADWDRWSCDFAFMMPCCIFDVVLWVFLISMLTLPALDVEEDLLEASVLATFSKSL